MIQQDSPLIEMKVLWGKVIPITPKLSTPPALQERETVLYKISHCDGAFYYFRAYGRTFIKRDGYWAEAPKGANPYYVMAIQEAIDRYGFETASQQTFIVADKKILEQE